MKTINKIIIVIPDYGLGGTQRVVSMLLSAWEAHYSLVLVTLSKTEKDFYSLPKSVKRVGLDLSYPTSSLAGAVCANIKRVIKLRSLFKRERGDLVISFLESTNVLSQLASLGQSLKTILCVRTDPLKQPRKLFWRILQRSTYRFANYVTVNNKVVAKWLEEFIPFKKIKYIPNPVKLGKTSLPEEKKKIILFVGRMHIEKGPDILIKAFLQSKLYYQGWQLLMVGEGPEIKNLVNLVQAEKLQNHVRFTGKQKNVTRYYQQAEIYVLPSRHEGMSNAFLEAMSFSLPVIVSDALEEPLAYVNKAKNGLAFVNESVESLANTLIKLAKNKSLRKSLGQNSIDSLEENKLDTVLSYWQTIIDGALL